MSDLAAIQPIPATGLACAHCGEELRVVGTFPDALRAECPTHGDVTRGCRICGAPIPSTGKRGRPWTLCQVHRPAAAVGSQELVA